MYIYYISRERQHACCCASRACPSYMSRTDSIDETMPPDMQSRTYCKYVCDLRGKDTKHTHYITCLLYTSDAADE